MALFSAVDSWMESVDKGHYVGALLLDFSKAFDTVPHQLLLSELQDIGCSIDTVTWFCNYLTDREQRVITYEQVTEWMKVSRGFPQGSGLSPLLFNIFTRRLPRHCISSALQFADDTTLASADPSLSVVAHNLTASFNSVKEFSEAHDLVLNPAKTQLIVFKPKGKKLPHDFHLLLNNCTVQPQKTVKLLGVTLDQHFTFGPHIDNVVNKCHGLLGTLARATPYLPRQLLKLSYTALIRSHLEYCSSLFTSAAKTHLKKLDTIQRIAARIIYEVPSDTHAEPLLILLQLDHLCDRRELHLAKMMKSFVSGKCHPAMKLLVDQLPYGALSVPQSRTALGKRRPSVIGATTFNHWSAYNSDSEEL